ncbi:mitochondrial division protein 1-like [Argonauta hians]
MLPSGEVKTPLQLEIRKLRKKLRQIENLERLDRSLCEEEIIKIRKRESIREHLRELLIEEAEIWAKQEAEHVALVDETELHYRQKEIHQDIAIEPEQEVETGDGEEEDESSNEVDVESETEIGENDDSEDLKTSNNKQTAADIGGGDVYRAQQVSPKKSKQAEPKVPKRVWSRSQFLVYNLEGHNDIITDIDSDGNILVSSSRDTTIRSWDLKTSQELHIFSSHTGSVTSLQLLNRTDSNRIDELHGNGKGDSLYLFSGSLDCHLKIWHVNSGRMTKSIYTYNPITRLFYISTEEIVITASDGGKLELWNVTTTDNIYSLLAYEASITGLQVSSNYIYSCSSEGLIKVHQWQNKKLRCMYESTNLRLANHTPVYQRNIRSFFVVDDRVFYGDDGINIKIVNWKKGIASKLLNHTEKFGVTDAIYCHDDTLYSSAYDLDKGLAYINVHSLSNEEYLGTLNDEVTNQIKCMTLCKGSIPGGDLLFSTGGHELKVWKLLATSKIPNDLSVVTVRYLPKLTMSGQISGDESDFSDDDDEYEGEEGETGGEYGSHNNTPHHHGDMTSDLNNSSSTPGWFSMCQIL